MKFAIALVLTLFTQVTLADPKCTLAGCECAATECKELDPTVISELTTVMIKNLSDNECIQIVKDLKVKYGCDSRVTDRMGGFGMLMTNCLLHESVNKCPGGKGEKLGPFYICKSDKADTVGMNSPSKKVTPKKEKPAEKSTTVR